MSFWKRSAPYCVGAGLSLVGSFGINYIGGSSSVEAKIAWAAAWGSLMWPFFIVPQFLVQWLLRSLVRRRSAGSFSIELLLMNVPIAILVASLLTYQYAVSSPGSRFREMVSKPIPESVKSLRQGGLRTMDSTFWVLRFEISRSDVENLLNNLHFIPLQVENASKRWDQNIKGYVQISKEDYLKRLRRRIAESANLEVSLSEDWQAYHLLDGKTEKFVFFNLSSTEAVFVLETH